VQRSFDDLGTPLHEVTFCVIDLETTGGSANSCEITEVGAVKLRGGECLGTFQTLVNPGVAIPPSITVLTGITQAMVLPAPRIAEVLPTLLEFVGRSVVVGHNVRFDISFLDAALAAHGRPRLANRWIDTCALARRLVAEEVPNCRLGTLACRLRLPHEPNHRALSDALATGDLLHALLERAGSLGVLGLDDLLELPTIRAHPSVNKLRLTARLPRTPGVYLFRGRSGRVLYVGKATNLRSRVRSYFSGEQRRKIGALLRELETIETVPCGGPLEASVLEVRLIHEHLPPYNRQAKLWRRYAYLKLTLDERFPRLSVVRVARDDGCLYLGPLPSTGAARHVADAIESVMPLRRCGKRVPRLPRPGQCAPAQLGVATCPCAGAIGETEYGEIVTRVVRGLTVEPDVFLVPLEARMQALADAHRFEEAADVRDRAAALARAIGRQRQLDGLRNAGRVELELPSGKAAVLAAGRLADEGRLPFDGHDVLWRVDRTECGEVAKEPRLPPLPRELADELACVARWLDAEAGRVRLLHCEGELASRLPRLPRFEARGGGRMAG
jgi:DNA polymerase-3 subunit epsilon